MRTSPQVWLCSTLLVAGKLNSSGFSACTARSRFGLLGRQQPAPGRVKLIDQDGDRQRHNESHHILQRAGGRETVTAGPSPPAHAGSAGRCACANECVRASRGRRSRKSSVFSRSSSRRSARSSAAASQLRSGAPAMTLMRITAQAIKPTIPSSAKKVVARALLVTQPQDHRPAEQQHQQAQNASQQKAVLEEPQPFPAELRLIQAGLDHCKSKTHTRSRFISANAISSINAAKPAYHHPPPPMLLQDAAQAQFLARRRSRGLADSWRQIHLPHLEGLGRIHIRQLRFLGRGIHAE